MISLLLSCNDNNGVITPEITSISESVYAPGFIKTKYQYEINGMPNSVIDKVFVVEGMAVKKGDPIFQLRNDNLKIATENARLTSIASDYRINSDKLKDAERVIDMVEKKLVSDSILYNRQKRLWEQNIGSKVEFEQKELNYENTRLELAKAQTNYQDLKRQLILASNQSKNSLELAKLTEDDFVIRSDVDGIVYQINKEIGESIFGQEVVAVFGTNDYYIELSIDELDVIKVKKEQRVFIRMDSYKSQVFQAKIVAIDPIMNKRTRSFQADAIFTNAPDELYPNLTVEANIVIHSKTDALTIPRNYLIKDSFVMLERGELHKVETGLMDYDLVEILSGIDDSTAIQLPQ